MTMSGVHAAMQAWIERTVPDDSDPDATLAYRWFGPVRAVLEAESDYMVLMRIETEPARRGQGEGSAVLEWLTDLCDRHGVTLLGQANADDGIGLSQQALLAWYARHGFQVDDTHQGQPLVWYPRRPGN